MEMPLNLPKKNVSKIITKTCTIHKFFFEIETLQTPKKKIFMSLPFMGVQRYSVP